MKKKTLRCSTKTDESDQPKHSNIFVFNLYKESLSHSQPLSALPMQMARLIRFFKRLKRHFVGLFYHSVAISY